MKKKPAVTNLRDDLGLTAADGGDIGGAGRFVSIIQQELSNLAAFSPLPDRVRKRLGILGRDAKLLSEFIEGYQDASQALRQRAKRRA
jgi:hypothetical protein